ncbi:MAG: undecaprenyl/decaprenyl-phosphate alpha-N-acetylglucosaminyl 1-phosphate transferase [Clostridiales bacterium]|jgi:UDP-GlcNAc:undecaprenyl-phosphate GlcNAc-1-phosphate transferase|nr:undecaprenyl/decaprenyl-phosphate alpha-N-acetylglucosaminyl 1-phosphate transferase [Clostridiales bacterium]
MEYDLLRLFFTLLVAFLVSFASTPVVKSLAYKIGAVDIPKDERRMHKTPIPRIGGLAIFYGFIVAILCFCDIDYTIRGILLGSVVIVSVGVLDDIFRLKALPKLFAQILAAGVVVLHGVQITYFTNPNIFSASPYISLGGWAIPVTILWIVAVTNAVNLIDGLDGLAAGVSSISCVSLFAISLITRETGISILTAAVAGAAFGFLPYNLHPAKLFMGDTGAMFLGYILACVSILGLFKGYAVISFAVPFLILGLPIFDTAFAVIRRLYNKQSPIAPDKGHLHHRLIDMGFDQRQTVAILCIASALLSMSAVVLTMSGAGRAMILICAVILLVWVGVGLMKNDSTAE